MVRFTLNTYLSATTLRHMERHAIHLRWRGSHLTHTKSGSETETVISATDCCTSGPHARHKGMNFWRLRERASSSHVLFVSLACSLRSSSRYPQLQECFLFLAAAERTSYRVHHFSLELLLKLLFRVRLATWLPSEELPRILLLSSAPPRMFASVPDIARARQISSLLTSGVSDPRLCLWP